MAVLWIFKKQEDLRFPKKYERKSKETSENYDGSNYTFIMPRDKEGTMKVYMLGQYLEIKNSHQFPEKDELVEKEYSYPQTFYSYLFIPPDKPIMYCMGNNYEVIVDIMKKHSNKNDFKITPIDLDKVEKGFNKGIIKISGQCYTSEQGTIKNVVRKIDGIPFEPNEQSFAPAEEVDKEYLEILVDFNGVHKRFNIYPNGKITCRGRLERDTTGINMLKAVYEEVQEAIKLISKK